MHTRKKVASYDFTDAKALERLRPPTPTIPLQHPATRDRLHPPPPPSPQESDERVCGGILDNPPLAVTLLLDRDSYVFGDEFTFILRVEALRPTRVQVSTSMAEIEPSDPKVSYEWRRSGCRFERSAAQCVDTRIPTQTDHVRRES